jgi:methionine synthase II (cobalamin-independent)
MSAHADELIRFLRRAFKAFPDVRVCIATVRTADDSERISFATTGNFDQVEDAVYIADTLLRHVGETIACGLHPECQTCRDRIKRIEQARAALDVGQRGLAS